MFASLFWRGIQSQCKNPRDHQECWKETSGSSLARGEPIIWYLWHLIQDRSYGKVDINVPAEGSSKAIPTSILSSASISWQTAILISVWWQRLVSCLQMSVSRPLAEWQGWVRPETRREVRSSSSRRGPASDMLPAISLHVATIDVWPGLIMTKCDTQQILTLMGKISALRHAQLNNIIIYIFFEIGQILCWNH